MRYYCTYFDSGYLSRALALYESLERYGGPFQLWALCMDEQAHSTLTKLALTHLTPIALADFERGDTALLEAKGNRSKVEYYFTCSPSLPLFVFKHNPQVDMVTYLDADLFLFASPEPIFAEMGDRSISIVGHRYPPALKYLEPHGIYNVGWQTFRRDEAGLACLHWWRERCNEWCYDRVEDGRFADQGYLNDWPERFEGVAVLQHKGVNLAPWNLANYRLAAGREGVTVDGESLMVFHFHGLKNVREGVYDPQLGRYGANLSSVVLKRIYAPYIRALRAASRRVVAAVGEPVRTASARPPIAPAEAPPRVSPVRRMARKLRAMLRSLRGPWRRRYIFVIKERVV